MSLTTRIHSSNQAIKQARQVNTKDLKIERVLGLQRCSIEAN